MSIYCANCSEAKVFIDERLQTQHRVRCDKNQWGERTRSILKLRKMHPPKLFTCPEYKPMGEDIEAFIKSLPRDKVDYENTWIKPKEVSRGKV